MLRKNIKSIYTKFGKDIIIILIIGTAIGLTLCKAETMASKWMVFILIACCGMSFFFVIPKKELLLLFSIFLFLSMSSVTYHPIFYHKPGVHWPVVGLKISLFDIPFFILFVLWLYRLTTNPQERIYFYPWISFPYLSILALAIAGSSRNLAPTIVFLTCLGLIIKNWLVFLFIANNLKKPQIIYAVTAVLILTIIPEIIIGLLQYVKGGMVGLEFLGERKSMMEVAMGDAGQAFRITGLFTSPNKLAAFLHMILPVTLALVFAQIDQWWKFILLTILALGSLVLLLTYSRGAWVGFGMGGSIVAYWCLVRLNGRKIFSLVIVATFVSICALSTIISVKSVRDRIFEDDHGSSDIRVWMKRNAHNMIKYNPFLGVSLGNYTEHSKFYDNTGIVGVSSLFPFPVHNEFLRFATELGLPALGIFLFLLLVIFVMLFRIGCSRADPIIPYIGIGFFGSFIAWCIHFTKDYYWVMMATNKWAYVGVIQAMYVITQTDKGRNTSSLLP